MNVESLHFARKRDEAPSRDYRRSERRFRVVAIEPGRKYRVTDENASHEYLARTCDHAMSQHVEKWKV